MTTGFARDVRLVAVPKDQARRQLVRAQRCSVLVSKSGAAGSQYMHSSWELVSVVSTWCLFLPTEVLERYIH
mgnify:FL=1